MATTIAVLGGTGKTGREVIKKLQVTDSFTGTMHVYVRSKAKLLGLFPDLSGEPRIKIFEGQLTDTSVMTACLDGAQVIICTIGENMNLRGVRVIQDAAISILAALKKLSRSNEQWERPQLLLLSSSTWNSRFAAARPAIVHWLIKTAFSHPYADLVKAQNLLLASPSLCHILLVQPPAIVEDEARGHEMSVESVKLMVTYADLGAGFVEAATTPGYQDLDEIGVSSQGPDQPLKYGPELGRRIGEGLFAQCFPAYWGWKERWTQFWGRK